MAFKCQNITSIPIASVAMGFRVPPPRLWLPCRFYKHPDPSSVRHFLASPLFATMFLQAFTVVNDTPMSGDRGVDRFRSDIRLRVVYNGSSTASHRSVREGWGKRWESERRSEECNTEKEREEGMRGRKGRRSEASPVVLLGAVLAAVDSYPQTFQYQRQLYYNPPLPALHQGILPAPSPAVQRQFVAQRPVEFTPRGNEPFVYVYTREGETAGSGGQVFVVRPRDDKEEESSGGSIFTNPFAVIQGYFPWTSGTGNKPEEKPTEAESVEITENQPETKPERVVEPAASQIASGVPTLADNQRRFFMAGPEQAQFFGAPSQFHFRGLQDQRGALNDRAGQAAINFQNYLALAKLKKKSHGEGFDNNAAIAVEAAEKNSAETSDEASTEGGAESAESSAVSVNQDLGPSIAQAKPHAVSVAGPGGVASAAPVGTAVVGAGGMALSAPSATAVAGAKGHKQASPAKLKAYFKQANLPGYFVQY
ncbi:hypothetical protein AAG570_008757 [Ranatra chinensis]|uniref:DUF4774 domain-containing protein n=1 Tax=Ranatra chinensis TaxID=642074 RepID=A0ABD0YRT4_9HEMI